MRGEAAVVFVTLRVDALLDGRVDVEDLVAELWVAAEALADRGVDLTREGAEALFDFDGMV